MKYLFRLLLILLLTVLTQTGGLLLSVAYLLQWKSPRKGGVWQYFGVLYFAGIFITPFIAKPLGRVPMPIFAKEEVPIAPQNLCLVLMNRHYVKPEMKTLALNAASGFYEKYPNVKVIYLDANFPFFDGFPLLPHRSHDDGEKLDLAFVYKKGNQLTSKAPAFMGYGRCEEPQNGETNQPARCAQSDYWQYSILKYLAQPFTGNKYAFSAEETRFLIRQFLNQKNTAKIFLEPHLKQRLRLGNQSKVRFHGCGAVRHDDHFHVQL